MLKLPYRGQAASKILFMIVFFIVFFAFSGSVFAETKTNDELQKAAVKDCGKGSGKEAACRNGFRHGYRDDENIQVACVTRDTSSVKYNKPEQEACKKGYGNGVKLKIKDGGGSKSSGRLGATGKYICGTIEEKGKSSDRNVHTKFDFGCLGTAFAKDPSKFPKSSKNISPILDFAYAVIRFLSIGVGIAITIALIVSGMQYSSSEGNAEASTKSKKRIESAVIGLVIYIFSWSILQFLVPGGVFK